MPNPEGLSPRRCVVTGASGYVGGAIVDACRRRGWSVSACSRSGRPPDAWSTPTARVDWVAYQLGGQIDEELLKGADALVHCAWDLSIHPRGAAARRNVEGSVDLLHAAVAAGVGRVVLVSSLAAFAGCRSSYGAEKLAVEGAFIGSGGYVVRPGLVWGGVGSGLFGRLARVASRVPLLPFPLPGNLALHLVHVDDLAEVVAALCATDHHPGLLVAAAAEPVRLAALVRALGSSSGWRPVLVPVPFALGYGALVLGEQLHLHLPFRADSLTSLVHPNPRPFADAEMTCEELGVGLRDFAPVVS